MNVLILSGRFGMGHVKAAAAIEEKIQSKGKIQSAELSVRTVDLIEYLFPHLSCGIYGGFRLLVSRCSHLYNLLNKTAEKTGATPLKAAACYKIRRLLAETDADLVLSVLPVCTQYFAAYKRESGCQIPFYTYVTDIPFHNEWYAAECDHYFVGARSTKEAFLFKGVPSSAVTVCGIPVRKSFRDVKRSLSAPSSRKKQILIMGGGLGLLPLHEKLLQALNARSDWNVTLITGRNRHLQRFVQKKYPRIQALGCVKNVCGCMQQADLLVTKPGGISTFEAIAARLPIFIVDPFLEQEIGNARFIESAGIGEVIWDRGRANSALSDEDAAEIMRRLSALLDDPAALQRMQRQMQQFSQSFGSFDPLDYYTKEAASYGMA